MLSAVFAVAYIQYVLLSVCVCLSHPGYLLGGDTTVPSGLYARFCHTFVINYVTVNLFEQLSGFYYFCAQG